MTEVYWLEQSEADVPAENDWLSANEVNRLNGMRFAKRRTDWRLGRWTAKRALAACLNFPTQSQALEAVKNPAGADRKVCEGRSGPVLRTPEGVCQPGNAGLFRSSLARIEIRSAPSGAPEVFFGNNLAPAPRSKAQAQTLTPRLPVVGPGPAPVTISLSHRAGVAVCAVALSGGALGCDLEMIEPRSDAFVADYFTMEEQALVGRASEADRPWLLALLWSGKESTLKVLGAGLRLDTRCVSVDGSGILDLQSEIGMVTPADAQQPQQGPAIRNLETEIDKWRPLQVRHTDGQTFHGWWQHTGNLLRTLVAAPPPLPPILLK